MDADIRLETAQANDFKGFIASHPGLGRILFNGRKAEQMFRKFVKLDSTIEMLPLPSTSPAYASMSFGAKLEAWRQEIDKGRYRQ